jgi:hypothetical protein
VKAKKIVGAKGPDVTQGEVRIKDIKAKENIEFDDIIGAEQSAE